MEDILDLYTEPFDPLRPVVCMDESPVQILDHMREPLLIKPGMVRKEDYTYKRNGTANLFMFFQPQGGWRHVEVTNHRTKVDWAHAMKWLADSIFPHVGQIRIVLDNLNTHSPAAFYESFPPEEARRLTTRFDFHYTPKHGSWLNMAELEIGILTRQCLKRRLNDYDTLKQEIYAWEEHRNALKATATWRFTCATARTKLKKLYPTL